MKKFIFILLLFFFAAAPAFSEEPQAAPDVTHGKSALKESGGQLITPRGNVYVGMSLEKLYDIFQEQDRVLIPNVLLSKECHIFKDWTSGNPNETMTFFVNADKVTGWHRGYVSACQNAGSGYEYNNDERIDTWFFPKEKTRWDGTKLNLLDWNKLTQVQKVMFITEYMKGFNLLHKTDITVNIDKYILGMNFYSDNCPESCRNISAADAVNNLLISDGKAKEEAQ